MPSPRMAQQARIATLIQNPPIFEDAQTNPADIHTNCDLKASVLQKMRKVYNDIKSCNSSDLHDENDSDVVVFISKMMPVKVSDLSGRDVAMLNQRIYNKARNENPNEIIG